MSAQAERLAKDLLENYDEHVKAHQRLQKWDNAFGSYKKLAGLERQRHVLYKEMGQAIAIDRALAQKGLTRADVAQFLRGAQIGATHNFKKETTIRMCQGTWCKARGLPKPDNQETCLDCGEPLINVVKPTPASDLRGKFAQHIVGVETKDGRNVWFDEMVPSRHHDYGEEEEPVRERPPAPNIPPRPLPRGRS